MKSLSEKIITKKRFRFEFKNLNSTLLLKFSEKFLIISSPMATRR
jgi:hypothetical protein